MMIDDINIERAGFDDLSDILNLQKIAFISEAELYDDYNIEPLNQTLDSIQNDFKVYLYLIAKHNNQIIGSVKARETGDFCWIGRLIVNPEYQNNGIGRMLLTEIQGLFSTTQRYMLCTGFRSTKNIRLYESLGFKIIEEVDDVNNPNVKMVRIDRKSTRLNSSHL